MPETLYSLRSQSLIPAYNKFKYFLTLGSDVLRLLLRLFTFVNLHTLFMFMIGDFSYDE